MRDVTRPPGSRGPRRMVPLVVAIVMAVATAACGGGEEDPLAAAGLDVGTSWVLTSMVVDDREVVLVDEAPVTLERGEDGVSGTAACNQYGTTDGMDGDTGGDAVFPPMFQTEMACVDDQVMLVESDYLAAMAVVTDVAADGEDVVMSGPGVQLRFAPA